LREGTDIRAVCKGANTEAQRDYIAVDLGQRLKGEGTPLSFDYHREVMPDHMRLQNRRVRTARRCFETVAEALPQAGECRPVGMDVDEAPLCENEGAHVVDAANVVGMRVGIDHPIDGLHIGHQHLVPEIGAGVYYDTCDASFGGYAFSISC